MSRATATALTILRVPRSAPRPSAEDFRAALARDRLQLNLEEQPLISEFAVAGPYSVAVNGAEFDEYVVWER